jgi:hypothetical protein
MSEQLRQGTVHLDDAPPVVGQRHRVLRAPEGSREETRPAFGHEPTLRRLLNGGIARTG